MTGLKINREVNIWSIITTIGAMLVAVVGTLLTGSAWMAKLEARIDQQERSIIANERMSLKLEASDIALTAKIDAARDLASGRQEAILRELATINSRQSRIEAILERSERSNRQ